ncbi:hypothetical protein CH304_00310 [Rhodococcus sp. 15-649-1-2]|nr:hypothetical protein [Rhodococcus sp. 15-649-1-2]OZE88047.1 hypothetical protein CH304_00310 [Rhodococcus sp. 15-649-1-2]
MSTVNQRAARRWEAIRETKDRRTWKSLRQQIEDIYGRAALAHAPNVVYVNDHCTSACSEQHTYTVGCEMRMVRRD